MYSALLDVFAEDANSPSPPLSRLAGDQAELQAGVCCITPLRHVAGHYSGRQAAIEHGRVFHRCSKQHELPRTVFVGWLCGIYAASSLRPGADRWAGSGLTRRARHG